MKQEVYQQPGTGCYRTAGGLRIVEQEDGGLAICRYPLRSLRLSARAIHVLRRCREQHTPEALAHQTGQTVERVRALCEQLRWKGLLEAGPALPPETWPGVSIIIPSHNRVRQLERCLHALYACDYPPARLEIIVVDDASTDESEDMLRRLTDEATARDITLHVLRHARQRGVAQGRNTGASAARHELLAYIDSDCVPSEGWLAELVPAFQDAKIAAVGGMIRAYEHESMLGRYEDVRSSLFMGPRAQRVSLEGPLTYLPTASLLVRHAAWQKLGGFGAFTFGEDVDFCRRLLAEGARILYLPQGTVYHDYRTKLWPFLRIRVAYASAEAALLREHPEERRVLVLPPEQATFAGSLVGGAWNMLSLPSRRLVGTKTSTRKASWYSLFCLLVASMVSVFGASRRLKKVQRQRLPIGALTILQATLRGHLAYTYHLSRHLTRYYTLPLLLTGLLLPPLLPLLLLLCGIVVGVDYIRLRPRMGLLAYAFCSLLDDCAYEVGVVLGCVKQRTWKPLFPIIRRSNTNAPR